MTSRFAISAIDNVDAVPRVDEPVRPLSSPRPRPRVAGPWRPAVGGVFVRDGGRRVVAQIIHLHGHNYWRWIVEGNYGTAASLEQAKSVADQYLRGCNWRLS